MARQKLTDLFKPDALAVLTEAAADLNFLLQRNYRMESALRLVGDRHQLRKPQLHALLRTLSLAPTAPERIRRRLTLATADLRNRNLAVDGYNVLITLETALASGPLLRCVDTCIRDISGVGARHRPTAKTNRALELAAAFLHSRTAPHGHHPASVQWLFDRPVSGSGRLAARLRELAAANNWPWESSTAPSPDGALSRMPERTVICTSDAALLDRVPVWFDLAGEIIAAHLPDAWIIDIRPEQNG
jgi:hypothetical protein